MPPRNSKIEEVDRVCVDDDGRVWALCPLSQIPIDKRAEYAEYFDANTDENSTAISSHAGSGVGMGSRFRIKQPGLLLPVGSRVTFEIESDPMQSGKLKVVGYV